MSYKYILPALMFLAACGGMQGSANLSTEAGADGSVFNDEDRADYRPGGDPVLNTSAGLSDEDQ